MHHYLYLYLVPLPLSDRQTVFFIALKTKASPIEWTHQESSPRAPPAPPHWPTTRRDVLDVNCATGTAGDGLGSGFCDEPTWARFRRCITPQRGVVRERGRVGYEATPWRIRREHLRNGADATLGDLVQAEALLDDTYTRFRRVMGHRHPDTPRIHETLLVTREELARTRASSHA